MSVGTVEHHPVTCFKSNINKFRLSLKAQYERGQVMTKRITSSHKLMLLIAIFVVSINLRPAITSIGPMLEIIREALLLTNTQVTLLTAIPIICMGVFASLAPVLNRKFGLSFSMYAMLLLIGVMTALRGFLSGFTILMGTAFIIGIAIAVIGPLLSAMIKQYFPHKTASVIGLYSFGMGVGSAASAGITGVLYETTNSYQFAIGIWAILSFLGLVTWGIASKRGVEVRQLAKTVGKQVGTTSPWKTRKAWLFLIFFGLQSALFFSIITWLAPLALAAGMTLLQAGTLLSVMTTVQIFLNIGLPLLMEKFPARLMWLSFILITGIIAIALLWTGSHLLMWCGAFLMGIPLGGLFPIALLLPLDETETAEEANSWTAMMQTGGFIIGGLLPLVIALIFDFTHNHQYTFIILMLLFLLMFVLAFFVSGEKSAVT